MFHNSTQKQHWLFSSPDELEQVRTATNRTYCEKHARAASENRLQLLLPAEERLLCQYYMKKLLEFCNLFQPPAPRSALATAAGYLKRFYLNTSVMEHHPRDIFLCCAYLAFKVDEYNVSVDQFVHVLAPQLRTSVADFVLSHELLLLKKLKFHLTVHSPFRPLEGFIIDLKTRSPGVPNPDQFRKAADSFLVRSLSSDVGLLYPPSQVALAALRYSSKQTKIEVDGYILSVLLRSEMPESAQKVMDCLRRIEEVVLATSLPDGAKVSPIEKKLIPILELSPKNSRKRKSEESAGDSAEKKSKVSEDQLISESPVPGISRLPESVP